jgi:hypothetical protein
MRGRYSKSNPYSKALGPRIAGGVLTGLGALNTIIGFAVDDSDLYADSYEQSLNNRELGDGLEKVIWIEGLLQIAVGLHL